MKQRQLEAAFFKLLPSLCCAPTARQPIRASLAPPLPETAPRVDRQLSATYRAAENETWNSGRIMQPEKGKPKAKEMKNRSGIKWFARSIPLILLCFLPGIVQG